MRKVLALTILGCVFFLSACGGDSFDNVAACKTWLSKTSCGSFDFSTAVSCDGYSSTTTCDLAPYFDCLTSNTSCANGVPNMSGWTQCTSKASCQ